MNCLFLFRVVSSDLFCFTFNADHVLGLLECAGYSLYVCDCRGERINIVYHFLASSCHRTTNIVESSNVVIVIDTDKRYNSLSQTIYMHRTGYGKGKCVHYRCFNERWSSAELFIETKTKALYFERQTFKWTLIFKRIKVFANVLINFAVLTPLWLSIGKSSTTCANDRINIYEISKEKQTPFKDSSTLPTKEIFCFCFFLHQIKKRMSNQKIEMSKNLKK